MLPWKLEGMFLFKLVLLCFSTRYPGVELLGHMVALFLVFWESSVLFSTVAAQIYIHTDCGMRVPFSPHPHQHLIFLLFLMTAVWTAVRWHLVLVLAYTCLIISNVEHLFMCLLMICISSLGKCLFSSALFLIGLFSYFGIRALAYIYTFVRTGNIFLWEKEIVMCVTPGTPSPHCFLVDSLCGIRLTKEQVFYGKKKGHRWKGFASAAWAVFQLHWALQFTASVQYESCAAICWRRRSWVQFLALSLISCTAWGKSVNVSEPFILLSNGDHNYAMEVWRKLSKMRYVRHPAQCLPHSRSELNKWEVIIIIIVYC